MRICFIADGRSPIARNWIAHFIARQWDVHVVSSYPCAPDSFIGAAVYEAPVALAGFSQSTSSKHPSAQPRRPPAFNRLKSRALAWASVITQHGVLPFDVRRQSGCVRRLIRQIAPDLVHAMRLPFEGIVAAKAMPADVPLMLSVWGNDFTLWAARNPLIARQTRQALGRADALHTDCRRDLQLAVTRWGFDAGKPATVLPGGGGIQTAQFHAGAPDERLRQQLGIADHAPVVINARGVRGYVRNDLFFAAIPLVLKKHPHAVFLCVAMQNHAMAEGWVKRSGIADSVRLLPQVTRDEMADLFRLAQVAVSPNRHDGTPNTLLEAMACGCLPVAGRIESIREWIDDEVNGLLCEATEVESLASAIIRALEDDGLRQAACKRNVQLITERAEYASVMRRAERLYNEMIARHHGELKSIAPLAR